MIPRFAISRRVILRDRDEKEKEKETSGENKN